MRLLCFFFDSAFESPLFFSLLNIDEKIGDMKARILISCYQQRKLPHFFLKQKPLFRKNKKSTLNRSNLDVPGDIDCTVLLCCWDSECVHSNRHPQCPSRLRSIPDHLRPAMAGPVLGARSVRNRSFSMAWDALGGAILCGAECNSHAGCEAVE